jgi:hypothetical protein
MTLRNLRPPFHITSFDKPLITEEALLREPNLWVPDRKPVGQVKIDWNHPLGANVIHAFLLRGLSAVDLFTKERLSKTGTPTFEANSIVFDTTNPDYFASSSTKFDFPDDEGTLIAKVRCDSSAGFRGVFSDKGSSVWNTTEGIAFYVGTSGPNRLYVVMNGTSLYRVGDTALTQGAVHTIATTFDPTNEIQIYIDGVADTFLASAGTYSTYTKSASSTITIGSYYDRAVDRSFTGLIEYAYAFDRSLTSSEIQSLTDDPYQFLIPA